jgi:hypothetical protein
MLCALFLFSCKKDNSTNSGGSETFNAAFVAPSQPGIIQTSTHHLILKKNNNATTSAKLYTSDGVLATPQPAFTWTSSDVNIVTVNNGAIHAVSLGSILVSVTDGSHGYDYITVDVVSDTTSISTNNPVDIVFTPPAGTVNVGQSITLTYKVLNAAGQIISVTPEFRSADSSSNITISGNSVTVGNQPGFFQIIPFFNGVRLNDSRFNLYARNPASSNTDTTWHVVGISLVTYPYFFSKLSDIASAVVIKVYELNYSLPGRFARETQMSPQTLIIEHPEVVRVNGDGVLVPVSFGSSVITAEYKGFRDSWVAGVAFDLLGNWGGTSKGKNYCFNFSNPYSTGIRYNVNYYYFGSFLISDAAIRNYQNGSYTIDGISGSFGDNIPHGFTYPSHGGGKIYGSVAAFDIPGYGDITVSAKDDNNSLECLIVAKNETFTLTRGEGDCSSNSNPQTRADSIKAILSNHTWKLSVMSCNLPYDIDLNGSASTNFLSQIPCKSDDSIRFNADGTYIWYTGQSICVDQGYGYNLQEPNPSWTGNWDYVTSMGLQDFRLSAFYVYGINSQYFFINGPYAQVYAISFNNSNIVFSGNFKIDQHQPYSYKDVILTFGLTRIQ